MEVYALVGPSGTGKSHRALMVASERRINLIIDDGLLIRANKIVAGISAKNEVSKLKAIRRAIFHHEDHARMVREALAEMDEDKILILGTSLQMVKKIVQRLQLNGLQEVINISEVATPHEIEEAQRHRNSQGKHVIPVPKIEVKQNFPGYLLESLYFLLRKKEDKPQLAEKTIIRPRFSWYGKLYISDNVMKELVVYTALQFDEVSQIPRVTIDSNQEDLTLYFELELNYGSNLLSVTEEIRDEVHRILEESTGIVVKEIEIKIVGLAVSKEG